jgi:hypothetical protein
MVMQGDTIVYNADAFNLAEGSMLDALVSKLPGCKLTNDGRIYVNGKYVESLLVDGHDFFSGDPKVALQNLPAYTVNKIKVYDKAGQASRLMGQDMGDKNYVMDVRLKKEYVDGYMGNVEAGLGTSHRYKLKLFGMKFSEKERFGLYANINNLNDNQKVLLDGEWHPQDLPNGLLATKAVGLQYVNWLNGIDSWVSTGAEYSHTSADNETRQTTETFLPDGNSTRNSVQKELGSTDKLFFQNGLQFDNGKAGTTDFLTLNYTHTSGHNHSLVQTSDSTSLLNQALAEGSSDLKNFNVKWESHNMVKVLNVDLLHLELSAQYDWLKRKAFALNDVNYLNDALLRDYRNTYLDAPHQNIELDAWVGYDWRYNKKTVTPYYKYSYTFNKTNNLLYRLDKLANRDSSRFDLLPSDRDELLDVADEGNSYRFHEYRNVHTVGLKYHDAYSKLTKGEVTIN